MYANKEKCDFWMTEVKFLGHVVSQEGILVDPTKVNGILQGERPKNVTEVHSFLGFGCVLQTFCQRFLQNSCTRD